jgi:hypothetical protein
MRYGDYTDCPADGFPAATIIIAGIALLFALLWLNEALKPAPPPPPAPKAPPPEPPKSAPGLPSGVVDAVDGELKVLQAQVAAFGYGALDPLLGPAFHRVKSLIEDYERRVGRMHESARRMIEK